MSTCDRKVTGTILNRVVLLHPLDRRFAIISFGRAIWISDQVAPPAEINNRTSKLNPPPPALD